MCVRCGDPEGEKQDRMTQTEWSIYIANVLQIVCVPLNDTDWQFEETANSLCVI